MSLLSSSSSLSNRFVVFFLLGLWLLYHDASTVTAFVQKAPLSPLPTSSWAFGGQERSMELSMAATAGRKKGGYEPKWKKKKTLAEELAEQGDVPRDFSQIGLKGDIPVVFKQGNQTKTTMALPGQSLRQVAIQAGQFIKYGCGKGECGTCECLVDGKWIRPCISNVPALSAGEQYVVQVKEVKNKAKSSGKFYSARSFVMGFWNNLLGMVGFVKYRRNAKNNRQERKEYEDLIRQKTLEKKAARRLAEHQEQAQQQQQPPK